MSSHSLVCSSRISLSPSVSFFGVVVASHPLHPSIRVFSPPSACSSSPSSLLHTFPLEKTAATLAHVSHFQRRGDSSVRASPLAINSILFFRRHRFFFRFFSGFFRDLFGILRGILKRGRGEKKKSRCHFRGHFGLSQSREHARMPGPRKRDDPVSSNRAQKHHCVKKKQKNN